MSLVSTRVVKMRVVLPATLRRQVVSDIMPVCVCVCVCLCVCAALVAMQAGMGQREETKQMHLDQFAWTGPVCEHVLPSHSRCRHHCTGSCTHAP